MGYEARLKLRGQATLILIREPNSDVYRLHASHVLSQSDPMPRHNKNWSPEEESRLLQGIADGKSFSIIAKDLNRTEAAVSSRANVIRSRNELPVLTVSDVEADPGARARPHPEPEDELGGGDICSLEWSPPDHDDQPL